MRLYISVDMEGISGIASIHQLGPGKREYERGRKLMTLEVKAAIEGAKDFGVDMIVVNDAHGSMTNLLLEELPDYVNVIYGFPKPLSMVSLMDEGFDAAFFIGYHSRKGIPYSIWDHTLSGVMIQRIRINDEEVSEFWLNAAVAGRFGIPVALVTGDDKLVAHAKELIPQIEVVETKKGLSRSAALMRHPLAVYETIKSAVRRALEKVKRNEIPVFAPKGPYEVSVEFTDSLIADFVELIPGVKRRDGLVVEYNTEDVLDVYKILELMLIISVGAKRLTGASYDNA
ncbi:MAG: M55 family metallopeptidase [Thermoprotei archaeon]|nr:M55 family metallopeptidase [Thermoprotei archaeon]